MIYSTEYSLLYALVFIILRVLHKYYELLSKAQRGDIFDQGVNQ